MKIRSLPSPNCDDRPAGVRPEILVLHYTDTNTLDETLAILVDPAREVSAHYVVAEDGTVVSLVPEDRRAWHAGKASWRGMPDVNARSIGIEIQNPGHRCGYRPFPAAQIDAVIGLARDICTRHAIAPRDVVGHSDVAPARRPNSRASATTARRPAWRTRPRRPCSSPSSAAIASACSTGRSTARRAH